MEELRVEEWRGWLVEDWIEIQPYKMGRADGSLGGDRACPACTNGSGEMEVIKNQHVKERKPVVELPWGLRRCRPGFKSGRRGVCDAYG
ncbi:hypothetical protein [Breznakibacter xylanolyticus]|uniref:hypothetical protein n=1 Tax=Breznakibacter xylanolyticus TaxID=990 RepID=UPI0011B4B6A8|nr:hypothetical protein [Breznakibacter xylanolyticus]